MLHNFMSCAVLLSLDGTIVCGDESSFLVLTSEHWRAQMKTLHRGGAQWRCDDDDTFESHLTSEGMHCLLHHAACLPDPSVTNSLRPRSDGHATDAFIQRRCTVPVLMS
jgi:hypothetical protein